jgi:MFS family permease
VLLSFGIARAFYGPASSSLLPNLVPQADLSSAIALSTSAWQSATIVGPVLGGLLYGISPYAAYGVALLLLAGSALLTLLIPRPQQLASHQATSIGELLAGFRYVWREKVVFGAISLDLFAVLLGGATALLPVYALDILNAGPEALGMLRAAPGIGAIAMALWLARYPVRDHAGLIMFGFVALFGIFTVIFGFSEIIWLSAIARRLWSRLIRGLNQALEPNTQTPAHSLLARGMAWRFQRHQTPWLSHMTIRRL